MSQFNYADYQKVVEAATKDVKIGYFRLKNDGDEALARINCSSLDNLQFASVHQIWTNTTKIKVSCANPLGSYSGHCALCEAAKQGVNGIGKASKKVYLQMIVSYKDPATGTFTEATPVIWERPAMFSRDIANKIRDWGDLRNVLFKITRNGKAGDMKTTYSLDIAPNTVYKPEMVPADFSAFNNFDISKHSYWEKTPEEIAEFVRTGSFSATEKSNTAPVQPTYTAPVTPVAPQPQATQPVYGYTTPYVAPATPVAPAPQAAVINPANPNPAGAPVQTAQPADNNRPARNFSGFSW